MTAEDTSVFLPLTLIFFSLFVAVTIVLWIVLRSRWVRPVEEDDGEYK